MRLKEIFDASRIKHVHVVDDAFDEDPIGGASDEEIQFFLDAAEDADLLVAAEVLGVASREDTVRESLQNSPGGFSELYRQKHRLGAKAAVALYDEFEKYRDGKRELLKPLVELLKKSGVEHTLFGSEYPLKDKPEPNIVFIDLKLNDREAGIDWRATALRIKRLLQEYPKCKPFVFLMSSLATDLARLRESFRESAELFQSEFESVDKAIFNDEVALELLLESNTRAMPVVARLRDSTNLIGTSLGSALENVVKELRALDLADYFVLHHNTVAVEETTIGMYLVRLLLEYLSHEVEGNDAIWDLYRGIEELNVQKLPRARFGLTTPAAKLYSASMLHSPKRLLAEASLGRGPTSGFFYLGDIFCTAKWLNEQLPTKAFVVITPACDLARPSAMAGTNILLCEGQVTEFVPDVIPNAPGNLPVVVMPHPQDTNKLLLVTWDKKKLVLWDDKERDKFKDAEKCHFVRIGRLRPVYAMQLQHAVTSDLSRIGTPRPPSLLVPRRVKAYVGDGGKKWKLIFDSVHADGGALAEHQKDEDRFLVYVVSDPAVAKTLEGVRSWLKVNAAADRAEGLLALSAPTIVDALQTFRQKIPKPGGDGAAYPLTASLPDGDKNRKLVAFVPSRASSSPFSGIRNGSRCKKDHEARLVLVFEDEPETPEPQDEVPQAEQPPKEAAGVLAMPPKVVADAKVELGPAAAMAAAACSQSDVPSQP